MNEEKNGVDMGCSFTWNRSSNFETWTYDCVSAMTFLLDDEGAQGHYLNYSEIWLLKQSHKLISARLEAYLVYNVIRLNIGGGYG